VSGFVRSRLARVHDVLARHTESGEIPGAVALIARGNETHVAVAGECRRDTIFRISSMTKPVTAAAAMICVEECALRLDDPVDALLPELAARRVLTQVDAPLSYTVPAVRPITVRDLLTFTFGLGLGETAIFDEPNGQWSSPPAFPSGAGGLVATIDDYAAFAGMLRGQGGYDLTVILMTQRMWTSPRPGAIFADFWTSAYQAIDD
jgi:CubicO group peptidase (beta-lactamase class C family)